MNETCNLPPGNVGFLLLYLSGAVGFGFSAGAFFAFDRIIAHDPARREVRSHLCVCLALRFSVPLGAEGGTPSEAAVALADSSNAELDRTRESAAQRAGTARWHTAGEPRFW
jgi:hypothetical protein